MGSAQKKKKKKKSWCEIKVQNVYGCVSYLAWISFMCIQSKFKYGILCEIKKKNEMLTNVLRTLVYE